MDRMTGQIQSVLVLGGARSGKSRYAQTLGEQSAKKRVFIATAQAGDSEMAARIAAHKAERDRGWHVVEAPFLLDAALRQTAAPDTVVLVDCLTLWLSNLMLASCDVAADSFRLAETISLLPGPAIFVSNEVGAGIVPDNRLARDFRDGQGRLNRLVAAACDTVVLVAAGLPLTLKPSTHKAPIL
jgi:adenosylcobinamide kinase / adenosylcobinamide-phosphate guanylyltransferase